MNCLFPATPLDAMLTSGDISFWIQISINRKECKYHILSLAIEELHEKP